MERQVSKITDRNKVGIVTFFRGNYGSVLQCYATCLSLKKYGLEPKVIEKRASRTYSTLRFGLRCLAYPKYISTFLRIRKKASSGSARIPRVDMEKMNAFIGEKLPVCHVAGSDLKKMGVDDRFLFFLSGSDQIWGGHEYIVDSTRFLKFAPPHKRVAWAPSFGTSDIAQYNMKMYKKYISQYAFLSVRETSGKQIVEELTGRNPKSLTDPVFLLDREEWLEMVSERKKENYILCFFLDALSSSTIDQIRCYAERYKAKIIAFGPWSDSYSKLDLKQIHGGPEMFVSLIANAKRVFTDSFHAVAFSLLLNTPFYVYRRNYAHGIDQSSRIRNILEKVNMSDLFEPKDVEEKTLDFSFANTVIAAERAEMLDYLSDCIRSCSGGRRIERD